MIFKILSTSLQCKRAPQQVHRCVPDQKLPLRPKLQEKQTGPSSQTETGGLFHSAVYTVLWKWWQLENCVWLLQSRGTQKHKPRSTGHHSQVIQAAAQEQGTQYETGASRCMYKLSSGKYWPSGAWQRESRKMVPTLCGLWRKLQPTLRCVFNKKLVSQIGCEDKLIDLFHRRTKCLSLLPRSYALGYSWLRTL